MPVDREIGCRTHEAGPSAFAELLRESGDEVSVQHHLESPSEVGDRRRTDVREVDGQTVVVDRGHEGLGLRQAVRLESPGEMEGRTAVPEAGLRHVAELGRSEGMLGDLVPVAPTQIPGVVGADEHRRNRSVRAQGLRSDDELAARGLHRLVMLGPTPPREDPPAPEFSPGPRNRGATNRLPVASM